MTSPTAAPTATGSAAPTTVSCEVESETIATLQAQRDAAERKYCLASQGAPARVGGESTGDRDQDNFGYAVAMADDRIAVGAPRSNGPANDVPDVGQVRVRSPRGYSEDWS